MLASDYKKFVLEEYDRQLSSGELLSELLLPTPANIKAEVIKICERGLSRQDENILKSFVGPKEDATAYKKTFFIDPADQFKPCVSFLRDRKIATNQRNIDLLALLIDFKPRPYHINLEIPEKVIPPIIDPKEEENSEEPESAISEPNDIPSPAGTPIPNPPQPPEAKNLYKLIAGILLILIIGTAGYFFIHKNQKHYTGHEGCMIWNNDHYEPIECNDQSTNAPHYPIDHNQVDHFKRITTPDTLTDFSINKVWYANYKGNVAFYTDSGANPLDSNYRVLKMSHHILDKWVRHISN